MDLGLKDKLALVTGSSKGIGLAIAKELAKEGARLILVARTKNLLKKISRELNYFHKDHVYYAVDLMSKGQARKLAETISKDIGVPEIIVHNLGGSLNITNYLSTAKEWQKVWYYNLGIALDLNEYFVPEMIKRKWGRIVMLSTLSTITYNGYAPYVSAKMALNGYVKSVGRQLAQHNVILTAVAPGAIYIEGRYFAKLEKEDPSMLDEYFRNHLPRAKLGRPEEIAPVLAFLCSKYATFMSGSIVGVDGGGI